MKKSKDEKRFKNMLNVEKDEIFRQMQKNKESEHDLSSREIEPEETAQKENMLFEKDRLEDMGQQEMEEIDRAMHKLETGSFGACESCGREISRERLTAVPWARYCKRCAPAKEKDKTTPADAVRQGTPVSDFEGMSDEELAHAVEEEIRYDGRVEMDEMEISCSDGAVYLDGYIAGEMERQILIDILENNIGIEKIEDHLVSDPLLFSRGDRGPNKNRQEKKDEEILFQGEGDDDPDEEGLSRSPSDVWTPERE